MPRTNIQPLSAGWQRIPGTMCTSRPRTLPGSTRWKSGLTHHPESHSQRNVQKCQGTHFQNRSVRPAIQHPLPSLRLDRHSGVDPGKDQKTLSIYFRDTTLVEIFPVRISLFTYADVILRFLIYESGGNLPSQIKFHNSLYIILCFLDRGNALVFNHAGRATVVSS